MKKCFQLNYHKLCDGEFEVIRGAQSKDLTTLGVKD